MHTLHGDIPLLPRTITHRTGVSEEESSNTPIIDIALLNTSVIPPFISIPKRQCKKPLTSDQLKKYENIKEENDPGSTRSNNRVINNPTEPSYENISYPNDNRSIPQSGDSDSYSSSRPSNNWSNLQRRLYNKELYTKRFNFRYNSRNPLPRYSGNDSWLNFTHHGRSILPYADNVPGNDKIFLERYSNTDSLSRFRGNLHSDNRNNNPIPRSRRTNFHPKKSDHRNDSSQIPRTPNSRSSTSRPVQVDSHLDEQAQINRNYFRSGGNINSRSENPILPFTDHSFASNVESRNWSYLNSTSNNQQIHSVSMTADLMG